MAERIITIGEDQVEVRLTRSNGRWEISRGDQTDLVTVIRIADGEAELIVNGEREHVYFSVEGETVRLFRRGEVFTAEVAPKSARRAGRHRDHSMTAPMPGVVLKIFVEPGAVVPRGAPLLILEAMKMEHQIAAPYDGTVTAVHCTVGELVQPGVELIVIDEQAGESSRPTGE